MISPLRWLSTALLASSALGIDLDITSSDSIKDAAKTIASGMMSYYTGNNTGDNPGNLPDPYYWWEAGAMFMTMVEYWYYTGDTTYNDNTIQAITWQAGKTGDFMPANQSTTEGNDDQVFWAYSAMAAAELNFPAPYDGYPSWLAMAQAVFNEQAGRWDAADCGGGLRWQVFAFNNGYNYKNQAANGGFFLLASRLARYTGNHTYIEWAEKEWTWFSNSTLYNPDTHNINDGTSIDNGCSDADQTQWTYNYGFYIAGLAYMYNTTEDEKWLEPLKGILDHTYATFFPEDKGKVAVEITCEPSGNCDDNGYTFKGYTLRWMAVAAQLVPSLAAGIWPYIQNSAKGAAQQCSGGNDGATCGMEWDKTQWDGTYGVGQQMSSLSAIQANLINTENLKPPYTTQTGGKSKGDPSAGTDGGQTGELPKVYTDEVTTGDKAGAGILTALLICLCVGGGYWMVVGG